MQTNDVHNLAHARVSNTYVHLCDTTVTRDGPLASHWILPWCDPLTSAQKKPQTFKHRHAGKGAFLTVIVWVGCTFYYSSNLNCSYRANHASVFKLWCLTLYVVLPAYHCFGHPHHIQVGNFKLIRNMYRCFTATQPKLYAWTWQEHMAQLHCHKKVHGIQHTYMHTCTRLQ